MLNTAEQTFRLPIKVKLASGNAVAGNGMTLGLQQGTKNAGTMVTGSGLDYRDDVYGKTNGTASYGATNFSAASVGITTDPTKSGIETSSQGLKLYFYVGETIQDANVIAASQVLTTLADCVRKSEADYVVESYKNGENWYRKYKSGWVEQGGTANAGGTVTVTFLKAFKDTNYTVVATTLGTHGEIYAQSINKTSGTAMTIYNYGGSASFKKSWYACGQGA